MLEKLPFPAKKRSVSNGLSEGRKSLKKAKAKRCRKEGKGRRALGEKKGEKREKKFESAYWPVSQEPGNQFRGGSGGVLVVTSHHSTTKIFGPVVEKKLGATLFLGLFCRQQKDPVFYSVHVVKGWDGGWCCELLDRTAQFYGPRALGPCWEGRGGSGGHPWSLGPPVQFNNGIVQVLG